MRDVMSHVFILIMNLKNSNFLEAIGSIVVLKAIRLTTNLVLSSVLCTWLLPGNSRPSLLSVTWLRYQSRTSRRLHWS